MRSFFLVLSLALATAGVVLFGLFAATVAAKDPTVHLTIGEHRGAPLGPGALPENI